MKLGKISFSPLCAKNSNFFPSRVHFILYLGSWWWYVCAGVYLNILFSFFFARSVKFCKLDIDHQPWYWIIKKSHIQWVHPPFHPLWHKGRFIRKIVPQSSHLWFWQSSGSNLACLWLSCNVFTPFFDNVNSYYREFAKARVSNLMPHETKNQYHHYRSKVFANLWG